MQTRSHHLNKLLAIAAALAVHGSAAAQTSVTVSGLVDGFAGSLRYSGDASNRSVVNSSGMTTSWFGFRGSEDLGGGLTARFALTGFFKTDTGQSGRFANDTLWSRDASIALSGGFGTVLLGRGLAPNFIPSVVANAFGDSFTFSPLILHSAVPLFNASGWTNSVQGDTGWSNEVIYTTPKIGGLTANFHYQFGEVAGDSSKRNAGANLFYTAGPISLTAYYHNVKVNNPLNGTIGNVQPAGNVPLPSGLFAARQTAWMVGGNYSLSAVKLFASYGQTSHDIDLDDKTLSLGAAIPLGSGRILAAWSRTERSGVAIVSDRERNTVSLGYVHDLSKRTDVYAVMMNDKITTQRDGNSFGMGMRHRF